MDNQKIVYITVEQEGKSIYRTFTGDFIKFSEATEIGETIQNMYESLETKAEGLFDEKK